MRLFLIYFFTFLFSFQLYGSKSRLNNDFVISVLMSDEFGYQNTWTINSNEDIILKVASREILMSNNPFNINIILTVEF